MWQGERLSPGQFSGTQVASGVSSGLAPTRAHPPPTSPRATTFRLAHRPARVSTAPSPGGGAVPRNVVARGGAGWCGALVGARSLVTMALEWAFRRAPPNVAGREALTRTVFRHPGRERRVERPGTHKGPSTPNLPPCHYISPGPPPRACVHRAVTWWWGGPPKCSGTGRCGVVRGPCGCQVACHDGA